MNTLNLDKFKELEFRTQPWFKQNEIQAFVRGLIPMESIVIHCFDPRATDIPAKVAEYFGDEVYPGENILDKFGNRIGSTRTLFQVTNAGGRAISALQSIATMEYLFHVERVVVVHHSFCGATAITPDVLVEEFNQKHHSDISNTFEHESLSISSFEESLNHDLKLLRSSPAVPKSVELYGFLYEINSGELIEVNKDIPVSTN